VSRTPQASWRHTGWTVGDGSGHEGYAVEHYFDAAGKYLGPDAHGIEPTFDAPPVNILARVEAAMRGDDEDQQKHSDNIAWIYSQASKESRTLVDDVFAALCGWTLRTILAGEDVNEGEEPLDYTVDGEEGDK
jgi:hypothetical protein